MEGRRAWKRENAREIRKTGCAVTRKERTRRENGRTNLEIESDNTREGKIENGRTQKRKRWI